MSILDSIRSEGEGFNVPAVASTIPVDLNINQVAEVVPKQISLTSEQRELVNRAKQSIDFMDARSIQSLDDGINQKLNGFNSDMLSRAKVSEIADMSPLITDVITKAKSMDPSILRNSDGSRKRGLLGLFGKTRDKFEAYRLQFETIEKHFDHIVGLLEQDVVKQKQSLDNMDNLYKINYQQYLDLFLSYLDCKFYYPSVTLGNIDACCSSSC